MSHSHLKRRAVVLGALALGTTTARPPRASTGITEFGAGCGQSEDEASVVVTQFDTGLHRAAGDSRIPVEAQIERPLAQSGRRELPVGLGVKGLIDQCVSEASAAEVA